MSPELQALIKLLDEGAASGSVSWLTRRGRYQQAMRDAANQLRGFSADQDARVAAALTPLRVRAFSKVK